MFISDTSAKAERKYGRSLIVLSVLLGLLICYYASSSTTVTATKAQTKTVIQVNGTTSTITSLGVETSTEATVWNDAESPEMMGVFGSEYRGGEVIGSAAFERASHNILIPDSINFWYPQKRPNDARYIKRTLSGTIAAKIVDPTYKDENGHDLDDADEPHVANIPGTYEDFDVNIDLLPSPKWMYLISEGHKPEKSLQQAAELRYESLRFHNPTGEYVDQCKEPSFKVVECEVNAGTNDPQKRAANTLATQTKAREGKQLAVYGPWIYDKGHCFQPEIHPTEEVWWSESLSNNRQQYHLNVFCDASERYWWRDQMDDGEKLKPWGAPPITGTYAIAFEEEIDKPGSVARSPNLKPGQKFEVSDVDDYNVQSTPNGDKAYNLVYQGRVLVSFVGTTDPFKVSFEKVGLKPGTDNIIQGFLVIETTVGTVTQLTTKLSIPVGNGFPPVQVNIPEGTDPNKIDQKYERQVFRKVEGHYMFTVMRTDMIGGGGNRVLK